MGTGLRFKTVMDGISAADEHSRRRIVSIVQGVVTALAGRLVGVAVSLLSVPLTIGYLGAERYGIWVLLSSFLAWIRLADLGIGNGLTNAVTGAIGSDQLDLAKTHVSTALAVLSAIALALGCLSLLVWPFIPWDAVFGVKGELARSEVGPAVAVSAAIFLLGFPLSVVGVTYNAAQNGRLGNYWGMVGNVACLVALLIVTRTHGGLVWLVVAVSGTGLIVKGLSGIWLFTRYQPALSPRIRAIRRGSAKSLLNVGLPFFLIQIMGLIVFQSDNLIIAHYLGANDVPTYSLTYNLFGYTTLVQTLAFSYTWVGYADALARGDTFWVRKSFRIHQLLSLGSTVAAVVPLIFIAQTFIRMWTRGAVEPPFELVLWMAAWSVINALCSPIAVLLAAAAQMRAQLAYASAAAIVNVLLSISLVKSWGMTGTIAGTVISYLICNCGPSIVDVELLLRRLDRTRSGLTLLRERAQALTTSSARPKAGSQAPARSSG